MSNIISLFSGVGGLDIGVEAATGLRVGLQVEADPFCRSVLAKHWPDAELHDDVRTIDWTGRKADLLIGGFPCQDVSLANPSPNGLEGNRSGLWFEMLRAIEEVSPTYVFIENVVGLRKRGLLTVLKGLRAAGYDAVWSPLSAKQVGAPHVRNRMWILAAKSGCFQSFDGRAPFGGTPCSAWLRGNGRVEPWERGTRRTTEAGNPTRKPRLKALGNAVVPECARQAFIGLNDHLLQLPPTSVVRAAGYDSLEDLVEVPMSGFMSGVFTGKASRLGPKSKKQTPMFPTPSASSYGSNRGGAAGRVGPVRHSLNSMATSGDWPTPRARDYKDSGSLPPSRINDAGKDTLGQRVARADLMYPTPTDPTKGGGTSRSGARKNECPSLHGMARHGVWPTPTVKGNYNKAGLTQKSGDGLATAVLKAKDCGPLNPSWVELLMGFDLGHTEVQS